MQKQLQKCVAIHCQSWEQRINQGRLNGKYHNAMAVTVKKVAVLEIRQYGASWCREYSMSPHRLGSNVPSNLHVCGCTTAVTLLRMGRLAPHSLACDSMCQIHLCMFLCQKKLPPSFSPFVAQSLTNVGHVSCAFRQFLQCLFPLTQSLFHAAS